MTERGYSTARNLPTATEVGCLNLFPFHKAEPPVSFIFKARDLKKKPIKKHQNDSWGIRQVLKCFDGFRINKSKAYGFDFFS